MPGTSNAIDEPSLIRVVRQKQAQCPRQQAQQIVADHDNKSQPQGFDLFLQVIVQIVVEIASGGEE